MEMSHRYFQLGTLLISLLPASAGTLSDAFSRNDLGADWKGDTMYFSIVDGALDGASVSPLAPAPFHLLEVGSDWSDYVVECDVNVVIPNLEVCTKGALVLRHRGNQAYVFAVHVATKTLEVYRLSDEKILLQKDAPLELKTWYRVRAELAGDLMRFFVDDQLIGTITDNSSSSGAVGVAVQDAAKVLFDNFSVSGPKIPSNGLSAEQTTNNILLTWPVGMTNYTLKSALELGPAANWQPITDFPTKNGDYYNLEIPLSGRTQFFFLFPNSL